MFVVAKLPLFWWPVTVRLPSPAQPGTFEAHTFEVRFELLEPEETDALSAEFDALDTPGDRAARRNWLLERAIHDWRDIVDDGGPIPFSKAALAQQLRRPPVLRALYAAYAEAMSGEKVRDREPPKLGN